MTTNQLSKVFAGLMIFSALATAQVFPPSQGDLAVSIPFGFNIDGKAMPAGEYIIHRDLEKSTLEICEDGVYCASIKVDMLDANSDQSGPNIVFEKQTGGYVLTSVRGGEDEFYQVPDCSRNGDCDTRRIKARKLRISTVAGLGVSWS